METYPENTEKQFKKQLSQLIKYLKDELSLITKGYYTAVGISLGVAFGAAFGSLFDIAIGVTFGRIIGLIIGASMDSAAENKTAF